VRIGPSVVTQRVQRSVVQQDPTSSKPRPLDPEVEAARQAAARVDLEHLKQHRAQPGLAKFMVPIDALHVPEVEVTGRRCPMCGSPIHSVEHRRQHVIARFAAEPPRMKCVLWGLGL
jgi:hypothetical protein